MLVFVSRSLVCFFPSNKVIDHLHSWVLVLKLEWHRLSQQLQTECDPCVLVHLQETESALRVELLTWCMALVDSECEALVDKNNVVPSVIYIPVKEYGYIVITNIIEELCCN